MTAVAAIDCGTNSTRLLVANEAGEELRRDMRITRLGQGVDSTGRLSDEALTRNYVALEEFAGSMRALNVVRSELIATSAARDAENGDTFLQRARQITGAHVEVLSGDQEAALSLLGATSSLPDDDRPTMIVDIGGGSTELASRLDGTIESFSMQIGCVRVTERALGSGIVTKDSARATLKMIDAALDTALAAVPRLNELIGHVRLVGLAGTVSTLASLDAGLSEYNRPAIHHRQLTLVDVIRWRDVLGATSAPGRLEFPGMVRGREDVIVAGLFVLARIMERFNSNTLLSSESDILDGLITTMLAK